MVSHTYFKYAWGISYCITLTIYSNNYVNDSITVIWDVQEKNEIFLFISFKYIPCFFLMNIVESKC